MPSESAPPSDAPPPPEAPDSAPNAPAASAHGQPVPSGQIAPDSSGPAPAPHAPEAAGLVFGSRLPLAVRFAEHLADTGISHGLLGPREVPRLWDRHILNCAVIAELIPQDATVLDVGSGAGLPGLAVALARPDLSVTLVEPMERRTAWLTMVTADLELTNVEVRRARAEELHGGVRAEVVTARAVAALDKLARWCLPLVVPGGRLVAMKGSSAQQEISQASTTLKRLGAGATSVRTCGAEVLTNPTTVVVVEVSSRPRGTRSGRRSR